MKRRNKNRRFFRWGRTLLCAGVVAMSAFLLPVQAEDVQFGSLYFSLPEEFSYQQGDSGLILKDGEQVGTVKAYPRPERIEEGIDWLQQLDLPEWQDESLGYYGDNTSLEFFGDVPPEQEQTVLTLHSFFWDDQTLYDLCLDELKVEDGQRQAILDSAAVGEKETPLPYDFGELPEGYAVIREDDGVKIISGSQIVGGVTVYPIPEGVYDPYDKWFTWLEDVGIPDYTDQELMLDGSISDFQGGWHADFRGLPEENGDEVPPVKRSHHFSVQDNTVYDAWVDVEALGDEQARALSCAMRYTPAARYQTITVYPEGEETACETEEVTHHGYSIFLPTEGWTFSSLEMVDGIPTDILEYEWNDAIQLRIAVLGGKDLAAARQWLQETYPKYNLIEDKRGGLGGEDNSGNELLAAFYPAENVTYAVIQMYPIEAAEGGGIWLSAFADTFVLHENASMTQEEADYLRCLWAMERVGYDAGSHYWITSVQERADAVVSVQYLTEGSAEGDKAMIITESAGKDFSREVLLSTEDGIYCNAGYETERKLTLHPCEEEHEVVPPMMVSYIWSKHFTRYLGSSTDENGEKISYQLVGKENDGSDAVLCTVDFYFDAQGNFVKTRWGDFCDLTMGITAAEESFHSLGEAAIRSEIEQAYQQAAD